MRKPQASALGIVTLPSTAVVFGNCGSFRLATYGNGSGAEGLGW